jgi:hypothetical protein
MIEGLKEAVKSGIKADKQTLKKRIAIWLDAYEVSSCPEMRQSIIDDIKKFETQLKELENI